MAVIVLLSGKCSPGVSTAVAALAYTWPAPMLVADADPAGGDLAAGWLGHWLFDGRLTTVRGVLSFATATRHARVGEAALLEPHTQSVPVAPGVHLLAGLSGPAQDASMGEAGWRRVAQALGDASATGGWDVLIDAGRRSPASIAALRPLLAIADQVLVALRPLPRHVVAARALATELARVVEPGVLGLAALASDTTGSRDLRRALGLPLVVEVPHDAHAAAVLSDGEHAGTPPPRSPLVTAARRAAAQLHTALNLRPPPAAEVQDATAAGAVVMPGEGS